MAVPNSHLTLASAASPTYHLHPVVVFSILDHYKRREDPQPRVIGTLMGERPTTDTVVIKGAFPVPHQEDADSVAVDMEYQVNMMGLYQQANAREQVVGWYSTGDQLTYISSLMHTVYRDLVSPPFEPVLILIDVNVQHLSMSIKAFEEQQVIVNNVPVLSSFSPVVLHMFGSTEERIGVDALIEGTPDDHDRLDAPAALLTETEQLNRSMIKLLDAIHVCHAYVEAVVRGRLKGDPELAHSIHTALNTIPTIDKETFNNILQNQVQDLLMVMYLGGLAKTQLAIADKVNALLQ